MNIINFIGILLLWACLFVSGHRASGVTLNHSIPGKHAAGMAFASIVLQQYIIYPYIKKLPFLFYI